MKRYICISLCLVVALALTALFAGGLATAALAQCGGHSGYAYHQTASFDQVGGQNGTYVIDNGSPAPGYNVSSSKQLASSHCEQTGTYVWDQGSPAPPDPCFEGGLQNHCTGGPAACPGHPGHGSCV
jgi:hypothetical protein